MKDLTSVPSWRAGRVRLADYVELLALTPTRFKSSAGGLIACFDRGEDEDEDSFERPVGEAFKELAERAAHLGAYATNYPFTLYEDELSLDRDKLEQKKGWLYLFLLLATNLNMTSDRSHAGLDGTQLFEHLSSEVAARFWGGHANDRRVQSCVFGTARVTWPENDDESVDIGAFGNAVRELCDALGEGREFKPKTDAKVSARDDKLDVVVWRRFSDMRSSQLIGFGQCKTGSHWKHELPRLNPDAFCRRWLDTMPATTPVKLFFLTDRISGDLTHDAYEAGVLFDRCRILDYADELPPKLVEACSRWTKAALKKHALVT